MKRSDRAPSPFDLFVREGRPTLLSRGLSFVLAFAMITSSSDGISLWASSVYAEQAPDEVAPAAESGSPEAEEASLAASGGQAGTGETTDADQDATQAQALSGHIADGGEQGSDESVQDAAQPDVAGEIPADQPGTAEDAAATSAEPASPAPRHQNLTADLPVTVTFLDEDGIPADPVAVSLRLQSRTAHWDGTAWGAFSGWADVTKADGSPVQQDLTADQVRASQYQDATYTFEGLSVQTVDDQGAYVSRTQYRVVEVGLDWEEGSPSENVTFEDSTDGIATYTATVVRGQDTPDDSSDDSRTTWRVTVSEDAVLSVEQADDGTEAPRVEWHEITNRVESVSVPEDEPADQPAQDDQPASSEDDQDADTQAPEDEPGQAAEDQSQSQVETLTSPDHPIVPAPEEGQSLPSRLLSLLGRLPGLAEADDATSATYTVTQRALGFDEGDTVAYTFDKAVTVTYGDPAQSQAVAADGALQVPASVTTFTVTVADGGQVTVTGPNSKETDQTKAQATSVTSTPVSQTLSADAPATSFDVRKVSYTSDESRAVTIFTNAYGYGAGDLITYTFDVPVYVGSSVSNPVTSVTVKAGDGPLQVTPVPTLPAGEGEEPTAVTSLTITMNPGTSTDIAEFSPLGSTQQTIEPLAAGASAVFSAQRTDLSKQTVLKKQWRDGNERDKPLGEDAFHMEFSADGGGKLDQARRQLRSPAGLHGRHPACPGQQGPRVQPQRVGLHQAWSAWL